MQKRMGTSASMTVITLLGVASLHCQRSESPSSAPPPNPAAALSGQATAAAPPVRASAAPPASTAPPSAPRVPSITFIPGSTTKLEQLIGDDDTETKKPTLTQSFSRFGVRGTDLGNSFEHAGLVYFTFGDTVGKVGRALDTIATTGATDPETGVKLDFLMEGSNYLTIRPPGISMGPFEVPLAGIDLGGQTYIVVRTGHSTNNDHSMLLRFKPPATFEPVREMSSRFLKMSIRAEPPQETIPGLPPGPYILVWATAQLRASDAYFYVIPASHFETGEGTRYFTGSDSSGKPTFGSKEADAAPIVVDGHLGDLSVTWCEALGVWLMTYDHREPGGIFFQYSKTPWGPWSPRQLIFDVRRDGAKFIHLPDRKPDDGLEGPIIGLGKGDAESRHGGAYAPYVVERWTRVRGQELDIYYDLSTWNPYVVMLMKSSFKLQ